MLQSQHDSVRSDVDVDVDRYQCYQYLVFVRRSVCRCACDRCPFPTPSTSLYSVPGWGMCQNEVRCWLAQFIIYPGIATLRLIDMTGLAQSLTQTLVHPLATHTHTLYLGPVTRFICFGLSCTNRARVCVCTGICIGIDIGNNWNSFCC